MPKSLSALQRDRQANAKQHLTSNGVNHR